MVEQSGRGRWQSIVETAAIALIAVGVAWQTLSPRRPLTLAAPAAQPSRPARPPEPPVPADPVSLDGAATTGPKTATAALIVYSDFQCPFCGKFERETYPAIKTKYVDQGRLRVVFREFPLTIHQFAEKAAEAAECAGRQGRFWEMHDQLFQHQQELDEKSLQTYATTAGVALKPFETCLAGETAAKVKEDTASGKALRVTGTPTFFLGTIQPDGRVKVTKRWSGAQSLAQVEIILDAATGAESQKSK